MRSLRFEIPKHPSLSMALERLQLRLDIPSHITPHIVIPIRNIALSGARPYIRRTWVGAIVSSTDVVTVERRSAISFRSGPFAHYDPFV
jgi:hypothetical protein